MPKLIIYYLLNKINKNGIICIENIKSVPFYALTYTYNIL